MFSFIILKFNLNVNLQKISRETYITYNSQSISNIDEEINKLCIPAFKVHFRNKKISHNLDMHVIRQVQI